MNSKIISFSLWGDKPMYTAGAIENIQLARELYPDWTCRFYVDLSVPKEITEKILEQNGEVWQITDKKGLFWGMFWRFFANDDPDMDVFISRDCDSRLSERERVAVQQWEDSDKLFHTMHDHYAHRSVPVLGGMWGAKRGCINNMREKVRGWRKYHAKGIDQTFLWNEIWNDVKATSINHSSLDNKYNIWAETIPFPEHKASRFGVKYVGEIFDEKNQPVPA